MQITSGIAWAQSIPVIRIRVDISEIYPLIIWRAPTIPLSLLDIEENLRKREQTQFISGPPVGKLLSVSQQKARECVEPAAL